VRLTSGTKRLVLVAGFLFLIAGIVSTWLFYNHKPAIAPAPESIAAAPPQAADDIAAPPQAADDIAAPPQGTVDIIKAPPGTVPEPYFLKHYEADPANRDRQTWKEYWHYVRQFYRGRLLTRGWHKLSEDVLATIDDTAQEQRLRIKLDVLGRRIAREWAKHSDAGKINTNDLIRWSRRLGTTDAPGGTGAVGVEAIVDDIRQEVDRRLGIRTAAGD
jgi:hypothetical protein